MVKIEGRRIFLVSQSKTWFERRKDWRRHHEQKGAEAPLEMIMFIRGQMRMRKAFLARWLLPLMR
jgi:hypothetical protein